MSISGSTPQPLTVNPNIPFVAFFLAVVDGIHGSTGIFLLVGSMYGQFGHSQSMVALTASLGVGEGSGTCQQLFFSAPRCPPPPPPAAALAALAVASNDPNLVLQRLTRTAQSLKSDVMR